MSKPNPPAGPAPSHKAYSRSRKTFTVKGGSTQNPNVEITYTIIEVIGKGTFGVVWKAKLVHSNEIVAIKKVPQNPAFKNRELSVMQKLDHCNINRLKYFFYSSEKEKSQEYLNLILEFVPMTLQKVVHQFATMRQPMSLTWVKVFTYQLLRSLAYLHSLGIGHRDITPNNLLVDPESGVLQLCDFGCAKKLGDGPNAAYVCSRYYRAPEILFGATDYKTSVDLWSAGCVLGEQLLNRPLFFAKSCVDQLVEIIKVLGTPSKQQIEQMNRKYMEFDYPKLEPTPWESVFKARSSSAEALDLLSQHLDYTPAKRIKPLKAMAHQFFDELRAPNAKLPNGKPLPDLFNFTDAELKMEPALNNQLIPPHLSPPKKKAMS